MKTILLALLTVSLLLAGCTDTDESVNDVGGNEVNGEMNVGNETNETSPGLDNSTMETGTT